MMRVCEKCSRHFRDEQCPFCNHRPRMNRAAMVIGASLAMTSVGPWYDRVFGCNQETVVSPYGAPQPPPDGGRMAAPIYGGPVPPVTPLTVAPTDASFPLIDASTRGDR